MISKVKKDISSNNDIKNLSAKLNEFKKELFDLRYKLATKDLKNTSLLKKCRKNIAITKTSIAISLMRKN
jgi:ribosomal protein L29